MNIYGIQEEEIEDFLDENKLTLTQITRTSQRFEIEKEKEKKK